MGKLCDREPIYHGSKGKIGVFGLTFPISCFACQVCMLLVLNDMGYE